MRNMESGFRAIVAALVIIGGALMYRTHRQSTRLAADGLDPAWDAAAQPVDGDRRPTLILFTADWCPACRRLHEETLSRADVREELRSHYRLLRVDLTDPSPAANAHARTLGVSAIPTLVLHNADGKEVDRAHYLSPEQMMSWLRQGE